MSGIRVLCCDIDHTIVHEHRSDGTTIPCGSGKGIGRVVVELLQAFCDAGVTVILATGRRMEHYRNIALLVPHHYALAEHGGLIVDRSGELVQAWQAALEPWIGTPDARRGILWDYAAQLRAERFTIDDVGRFASFRVSAAPGGFSGELVRLAQRVHPSGITAVWNLRKLDFVPTRAGKLNALNFVLGQLQASLQQVAAVGDDRNDVELLRVAGYPCTFETADSSALAAVCFSQTGYVTRASGHEGAVDILRQLREGLGV